MAEPSPPGLTFFVAMTRAIVSASFVKRPSGGCVESVSIWCDHLRTPLFFAVRVGAFVRVIFLADLLRAVLLFGRFPAASFYLTIARFFALRSGD
jgi:hypothetical protein